MVAGLSTVDLIARPVPLGTPISPGALAAIDRVDMTTGGFVSNVARALVTLGVPVAALADVGDDPFAQFVRSALSETGVDVSGLSQRAGSRTAATVVLVDSEGERSFLFAAGASKHFDAAQTLSRLETFESCQWFLFGYYSLFPEVDEQLPTLFQWSRQKGLKTALDAAGHGGGPEPLVRILPFVDCYIPSENEARRQTNCDDPHDMIERLRGFGAAGVVGVKLGARGALVSVVPGHLEHIPALAEPAAVVDTTGAGDAFLAGYVAGRVRGRDDRSALKIAAATSACCVSGVGASSGIRPWGPTCELAGTDSD